MDASVSNGVYSDEKLISAILSNEIYLHRSAELDALERSQLLPLRVDSESFG
jgi:hypothetical protein